jgi:hypothetical protein
MGKCRLHCSRNPSAYVANVVASGIVHSTVRSMNYLIQKPGDVGVKTILSWTFVLPSRVVRFNWIGKHGTMARK